MTCIDCTTVASGKKLLTSATIRRSCAELFVQFGGITEVTARDANSDATLLARIRAGDAVALATVYRRRSAAVFRFACLHAPSREAAADATQETFLWLATNRATTFDPNQGSLAAFLCGVARNHVLRICAADARYDAPPDEASAADGDSHQAVEDALTQLLATERGTALHKGLARLAVEQREVIALVEFEEFSYAEAANIIGCPIGTVRSRLNRAKEALRAQLVELFPDETRTSL